MILLNFHEGRHFKAFIKGEGATVSEAATGGRLE
jgi:hypothetical protein